MHKYAALLAPLFLALVLIEAIAPAQAQAQQPPPPAPSAEALIEAARAALAKGAPDDAELLLEGVEPDEGNLDDLDFLHGSIALHRGEWQAAIARFRAMLARNPDLPRVRLDLAFAHFQAGEDGRAAHHFRLALGTKDLPPAVRERALAFLDRIRRRKTWSITGSVALAPDSNINNATSATEVELFGLPAQLSEDAREASGVGLNVNLGGGYEGRISPDVRFRTSAGLNTRTYRDSQFNERSVNLRAGPRFLFERFDLRPELTTSVRDLGGDLYSRSAGLELSGNWLLAPSWRLNAAVGGERVSYETFLGDGHTFFADLGLAHALGRATQVRADTSFRRENLDDDAYSWREYILGASVTRELPPGVRGGRGAALPVARVRRAAAGLRLGGAAGPNPGGANHRIEPAYRLVRLLASNHASARASRQQPRPLRLPAHGRGVQPDPHVLMSMHRLMALSTVCGSMSFTPCRRRWGAAAPPSGTPSAAPLPPASSSRRRGDVRPAPGAIGSRDGGRLAAATEPAASMSLVRRTCGAGSSASRPRIAPRWAERWRRWRRPGRGRLRVRRARRAGGPRLVGGGAGGRSRQRDAGAADGRRERWERPAGGEPELPRNRGDPRQRDDDARRGGVRRVPPGELVPA